MGHQPSCIVAPFGLPHEKFAARNASHIAGIEVRGAHRTSGNLLDSVPGGEQIVDDKDGS